MTAALWSLAGAALAFWAAVVLDRRRRWPEALRLERGPEGKTPAGGDGKLRDGNQGARAGGDSAGEAAPGATGGAGDGGGDGGGGQGVPPAAGGLVVVIPARDEADVLPQTLPALLRQAASFERLVIVDDGSSDGTGDAARRLIAGVARAEDRGKTHVLAAPTLPEGWSGKIHALKAGLESAAAEVPFDRILFTDADILHTMGSVEALARKAEEGAYDLVSVMARLRCASYWERLLIPAFVYFFHFLYPFRSVIHPRSSLAAAAGGCLLVRRALLERAGGLEAIRGAVIDDVALAQRVKKAGGRLWLGLDPGVLSLRAYRSLNDVARMVARTAFAQLGYRWWLVPPTLVFLGIFFAAPPLVAAVAAATGVWSAAALAALAWGLQAAHYLPAVRHEGAPSLYAWTLPLAASLYGWMTLLSAWNHFRSGGPEWKARRLPG